MGKALPALKIPIGEVFTSPTYRALETVRLVQLPNPRAQDEPGSFIALLCCSSRSASSDNNDGDPGRERTQLAESELFRM
jgi:hypothetical protein